MEIKISSYQGTLLSATIAEGELQCVRRERVPVGFKVTMKGVNAESKFDAKIS